MTSINYNVHLPYGQCFSNYVISSPITLKPDDNIKFIIDWGNTAPGSYYIWWYDIYSNIAGLGYINISVNNNPLSGGPEIIAAYPNQLINNPRYLWTYLHDGTFVGSGTWIYDYRWSPINSIDSLTISSIELIRF